MSTYGCEVLGIGRTSPTRDSSQRPHGSANSPIMGSSNGVNHIGSLAPVPLLPAATTTQDSSQRPHSTDNSIIVSSSDGVNRISSLSPTRAPATARTAHAASRRHHGTEEHIVDGDTEMNILDAHNDHEVVGIR